MQAGGPAVQRPPVGNMPGCVSGIGKKGSVAGPLDRKGKKGKSQGPGLSRDQVLEAGVGFSSRWMEAIGGL